VQSHAFALSPPRAASGASQVSAGTPVRTVLPVPEVPASPQSVKKRGEEMTVVTQGKDGSSKRAASRKRLRPASLCV
jgi:hypothetical protein